MISIDTNNFQQWLSIAHQKATGWDLRVSEGTFYLKVIKAKNGQDQPLPYAFVCRNTGTVYLAANWRFPSKKYPRGTIFDADFGASKLGPDGPIHMHNGKPLGFKHKNSLKSC